jgi:hypothetical protein
LALRIAEPSAQLLAATRDGLLLGIITAEQEVRLKMADATRITGHREWLAHEPVADVVRGVCVLVREGLVRALFPLSRLNPTPDAKLEESLIAALGRLSPVSADYKVFRY